MERTLDDLSYMILSVLYDDRECTDGQIWEKIYLVPPYLFQKSDDCAAKAERLWKQEYIDRLKDPLDRDGHKYKTKEAGKRKFEYETLIRAQLREAESLQRTLLEVSIKNNKWSPVFAGLAGLFALASIFIAYMQYDKPSEKLQPEMQETRSVLQQQAQWLDSLQRKMQRVDSSLRRIADSLKRK
jgi:hypothetical protein